MKTSSHLNTRKLKIKTKSLALTAIIAVGTLTLFAFQNCNRVSIASSEKMSYNALAEPFVSLSQNTITTNVNTPAKVKLENPVAGAIVSLDASTLVENLKIQNGLVEINGETRELVFTPEFGFRGRTTVAVYSKFGTVTNIQNLTFVVENPKLLYNPALAIRGGECIACHAKVKGDFITDFGFKSKNDTGPDYFFSVGQNSGISPYNVAHTGSKSFATSTIAGKLIVPKVKFNDLDSKIMRTFHYAVGELESLKDYILAFEKPIGPSFQGVSEKSAIYIGSPTAQEIRTAGKLTATELTAFYKNSPDSPPLSGLTRITKDADLDYYTNSNTLVCEGDVFVDGVVFLNSLNLETKEGCRLYVTRSVFINGPLTYVNQLALSNLEIVSAVGIYMGFGYCIDCAGSTGFNYAGRNTLAARWADHASHYLPGFRSSDTKTHVANINSDFAKVSRIPAAVPTDLTPAGLRDLGFNLIDATNSFKGESDTSYSRLLLVAPDVQSRYTGNFQGIVIAEFALWRLSNFHFSFEPIFTGVPLLPFLNLDKILKVE